VLLCIKYVLKTAPPRCMVVWWFTHKVLLNIYMCRYYLGTLIF